MGVETRAGARIAQAAAAAAAVNARSRLLALPDPLLERILVEASDGGEWVQLCAACLACARLCAAADAAVQQMPLRIYDRDTALAKLPLLRRLSGLARLHLWLDFSEEGSHGRTVKLIAKKVHKHCPGLASLKIMSYAPAAIGKHLSRGVALLMGPNVGASPSAGAAALLALPRLASLSLNWSDTLRQPLTPLARLTRLTALELSGFAYGAQRSDWLPPNLEELRLGSYDDKPWESLRGFGGVGWLVALHDGACPRLRALRLNKLAPSDLRQADGQPVTLASALPRLTRLEELAATAYETLDIDHYQHLEDEGIHFDAYESWEYGDDDEDGVISYILPIKAAPLLAALPNLRHCHATFVRRCFNLDEGGSLYDHGRTTPMLLATPAELAALHAPRLESLAVGLVASPDINNVRLVCYNCYNADAGGAAQGEGAASSAANATAAAAAAAAAAGSSVSIGLLAMRSLELHVGCCSRALYGRSSPLWGLSALPPGSLPALRRLLVLPISFKCCRAKLPLDAVARGAPALERLVIDPRCAGPLDALFCDGGCAHALRTLLVLPPPGDAAAAHARIDAKLRSGLLQRAAALAGHGVGHADPCIEITLFSKGQPGECPPDDPYPRGADIERRSFGDEDGRGVANFSDIGLRRGMLPANA